MSAPLCTTELRSVEFTVRVDWPDADVDAVFAEIGGRMTVIKHEVKSRTPTADSVERFTRALCHDDVLKRERVYVRSHTSLMMGGCNVTFEIHPDRLADFDAVLDLVKRRISYHRVRRVRYHATGRKLGRSTAIAGFA